MIITISLDIKKSVEICDNLWTKKKSVEKKKKSVDEIRDVISRNNSQ